MKPQYGWHFVFDDKCLSHDAQDVVVAPGYIYEYDGPSPLILSHRGLHWSKHLIDAIKYAHGSVICRVRAWGDTIQGDDKCVSRFREVLWMVDGARLLHEFAVWCVRHTPINDTKTVWDLLTDERSRDAVVAKERWLRGEITDDELYAALSAAESVALSAALSAARYAAESAAQYAAQYAAESEAQYAAQYAARSAAESAARSAARSAAESVDQSAAIAAKYAQNKQLTRMIMRAPRITA